MATPLPGQLRYLEPVFTELTRVSADRLNEDVDVSTLEGVLRGRVHGLTIPQAQERLDHDRSILRDWLKNSPSNHASGQWVVAFLSYRPGLHASSRSTTARHRRVLRIEYAASMLPAGLQWQEAG
jgi:hypothetical protein